MSQSPSRHHVRGNKRLYKLSAAFLAYGLVGLAVAAETETDEELDEVVVVGDRLNVMQNDPVTSVFGFGKKVEDTPRAVTTISAELLEQSIITEIDDLVALTPGSFTQSFFGVAGSLDVRGTPGENYFRGIKRIDNPGNYPTPIGASDRIDVVRGPASPIYGPSKIGGYMNFVPKSARASNGRYLAEPKAALGLNLGSYGKRVVTAEVGGPLAVGKKDVGYYLYGEVEDSDSFYENSAVKQTILQASFDAKLSDTWRSEFGGMFQSFRGNQVAGWNRLTQDLIDNGTYITGSPPSLDENSDGLLGRDEAMEEGLNPFYPFVMPGANMALTNPGTTKLKRSQVLVQDDDSLRDDVYTLYFDLIGEFAGGSTVQNKMYFESLDNNNENAYGFSQYAKTYVAEDQLIFARTMEFESVKAGFQLSPSIRYQDFEHGDNWNYEYFDRRDLSLGAFGGSAIDRRAMATRGQEPYSTHTIGRFIDYGAAALADLTFFDAINFVGGGRYDYIDMSSVALPDSIDPFSYGPIAGQRFTDKDGAFSWSASLSYDIMGTVRPYVSFARQSTLILGQGGQIPTPSVAAGDAIGQSKLKELGIKGTFLEGKLFAAVNYFDQERMDYNAQDTVTNNTTRAEGYEGELRWVVNPVLTVTGAYSNLEVHNLGNAVVQFSFMGAEDLRNEGLNPSSVYGGTLGWNVNVDDDRKAGIPKNIASLNLMFSLDAMFPGLSGTLSATHADSVWSGYSKVVKLPAYMLLNAGLRYQKGSWAVGLQGKNLTDKTYFRSNFPDLFGSSIVLPELPRTLLVTTDFKF